MKCSLTQPNAINRAVLNTMHNPKITLNAASGAICRGFVRNPEIYWGILTVLVAITATESYGYTQ